jgi:hypothetical protein
MNKLISFSFTLILTFSLNALGQTTIYDEVNEQSLTDEEKAGADSYLHGGLVEQAYMEKCVAEDGLVKEECQEARTAFESGSTMGDIEKMMPMIKVAYSSFSSLATGSQPGQNKMTYTGKKIEGDTTGARQPNKEGTDYCAMIPPTVETAATEVARIQNQQIEGNIKNSGAPQAQQAEAFYSMANVQENLAKSSRTQSYGWGTTAGCYATLMATGSIATNTSVIIKTSASALLTTYFIKKTQAHKERAEAYKKLAEGFPQAGECNPFSNTSCFCLEKTSATSDPVNFKKFCVPSELHSADPTAVSCVTKDFKPDPSCSCRSKGTCIQARLASVGHSIGLEPTLMNNILKGARPYSSGFAGGNLEGITSKNLAFAKKQLKKVKPTKVSFKNKKQKDLAKDMVKLGIPKFGAAKLATTKATNNLPRSFSNFGSDFRRRTSSKVTSKSNKARFTRGKTARKSYSSSRRSRRGSRGGSKAKAIEIEDFASKAEKSAMNGMISKDKSRPIFDIITYRYKTSAWREFKDQMAKELKEVPESETSEKK